MISTYDVTIRLETDPALEFRRKGRHWVARDKNGSWRAHGEERFATTAAEAAPALFHAEEIACIKDHGDHAIVSLFSY